MAQLQQDNIFFDVQQKVCDILNATGELSAIQFLPENKKDIENDITIALKRQGIVGVVMVQDASFQGFDSGIDTAWQIDNLVVQVVENVVVNRAGNNSKFVGTAEDVGSKVSQVLGSPEYGNHRVFNLKTIEVGEDNGLIVCKVSMKCLVTTAISAIVPPVDPSIKIPFVTQDYLSSNYYDKIEIDDKLSSLGALEPATPDKLGGIKATAKYITLSSDGTITRLDCDTATVADTANHALNADNANFATNAGEANHALTADYALTADNALTADHAYSSDTALTADNALTADYALTADTANYAENAQNAAWSQWSQGCDIANDVQENSTTLQKYVTLVKFNETIGNLSSIIHNM